MAAQNGPIRTWLFSFLHFTKDLYTLSIFSPSQFSHFNVTNFIHFHKGFRFSVDSFLIFIFSLLFSVWFFSSYLNFLPVDFIFFTPADAERLCRRPPLRTFCFTSVDVILQTVLMTSVLENAAESLVKVVLSSHKQEGEKWRNSRKGFCHTVVFTQTPLGVAAGHMSPPPHIKKPWRRSVNPVGCRRNWRLGVFMNKNRL